jgi:hypothetical protein
MALDFYDRVLEATKIFAAGFFMEIFTLASWEIWKLRNSIIFDNGVVSFNTWSRNFRSQVTLQLMRVDETKWSIFSHWLETLT